MSFHTDLVLSGAVVYPSGQDVPLHNAAILMQGGKIAGVGGEFHGVPTIDCSGCTITAGFWNSHVHFFERKWADAASIPAAELGRQLEQMLTRYGFTSVFDLGSKWANTRLIRDRVESGEVKGPKIRSTGEGLLSLNAGLPSDAVMGMMGVMKAPFPEVADPAQASEVATRLLSDGVDAIKLFVSSPSKASLSEEIIAAAVSEAHKAGKPVFVHPNNSADVRTAVRGGVDVIGHTTPHSGPWEESLLDEMAERRVALTPTLTLWKYYARHDRISTQDRIAGTATGQLRAWLERGGEVLFGTDLGAVDYDPSEEYRLMAQSGMDFAQILASMTTAPAKRFGDSAKGRIAVGYDADLVVLNGDPGKDLRALTDVRYTFLAAELVYSAVSSDSPVKLVDPSSIAL
jgi:imidazolonepropionase-like amidohydrolase